MNSESPNIPSKRHSESDALMKDRIKIQEGISKGERAILDERAYTQDEAKQRMKKWLS